MKTLVWSFALVFFSVSLCNASRLSWAYSPTDPKIHSFIEKTIFACHAQTRVDRAPFLTTFFPKIMNFNMYKYRLEPSRGVSYKIDVTFAQLMESMIILLPPEQYKKFIAIPISEVVLEARVKPDAGVIFPSSQDIELYEKFTMDTIEYLSIIENTPLKSEDVKFLRESYSQVVDTLHYPAEYDPERQRLMLHAHHNIFMEFLHFINDFTISHQDSRNSRSYPHAPAKAPPSKIKLDDKPSSSFMEWECDETKGLYAEARKHVPKPKCLGEGSSEESAEDAEFCDWKLLK